MKKYFTIFVVAIRRSLHFRLILNIIILKGITTGIRNITKGIAGALKIMTGMIIAEEETGIIAGEIETVIKNTSVTLT